jgi:L-lactate dehydrogenase complex protein LldG
MNAREEMLGRVRAARAGAERVEPARDYRAGGEHEPGAAERLSLLDLLEDRLRDYKAAVRRADAGGLRAAVAEALAEGLAATGGNGPVLLAPDLPSEWAPDGHADDGTLTPVELDGYAAVVTACRVACAQTGTIVLDGEPDQGRRAITLVPDVHVCVVRADQVVLGVPEMMARLEAVRPTTFISGPSATSDIELDRVEGVHGPRTLSVVLVTA